MIRDDGPEPDWEARGLTPAACQTLKAELRIELRAARAEWDAAHQAAPSLDPRETAPKARDWGFNPDRLLARLGRPPSASGRYNATAHGVIRKTRAGSRPSNLDAVELAAYYAEPDYVLVCKRRDNAHWRDDRADYLWRVGQITGGEE